MGPQKFNYLHLVPCRYSTGLNRPLGLQEFEAPRMNRKLTHEGGKTVSRMHRPPVLPPEILLLLISVTGGVDPRYIVRREG